MKLNKRLVSKACVFVGIGFVLAGILIFFFWQLNIHSSMKKSDSYIKSLHTLIPTPQGAVLEERRDNTMPILSVEGTDFVGILEMPRYGSELPVCADWGNVTKYPCRLSGSVYDRTLQIGATSQKGQYDFYREISVGDTAIFTDMEGNRYTYAVTDLRYVKNVNGSTLESENSALTIFIKNVYDFEYLLVFCNVVE